MRNDAILEPDIRAFVKFWIEEHGEQPALRLTRIVCPDCDGRGGHAKHLGAYTQSDRDEMGEEWFEFADDMRAGHYDQRCDTCQGLRVIDDVALQDTDPALRSELISWLTDAANDRAESAQERRMGA